jgi:hypothetical protein
MFIVTAAMSPNLTTTKSGSLIISNTGENRTSSRNAVYIAFKSDNSHNNVCVIFHFVMLFWVRFKKCQTMKRGWHHCKINCLLPHRRLRRLVKYWLGNSLVLLSIACGLFVRGETTYSDVLMLSVRADRPLHRVDLCCRKITPCLTLSGAELELRSSRVWQYKRWKQSRDLV